MMPWVMNVVFCNDKQHQSARDRQYIGYHFQQKIVQTELHVPYCARNKPPKRQERIPTTPPDKLEISPKKDYNSRDRLKGVSCGG